MGKRSDFARRRADAYQTIDPRAVRALLPHLKRNHIKTFIEPCCGERRLVAELERQGLTCVWASDIEVDALTLCPSQLPPADAIVTNPPWTRGVLHPMIMSFQKCSRQTWLLFDGDWAFNKQAGPYLDQCSDIVAIGRLRWIEGTTMTGKENAAWYRFAARHSGGPKFHGRYV